MPGIPLVYVNREPINVDQLPENAGFRRLRTRSESGTLETQEVCRLLTAARANIVVMMGELSNQAARQRTQDVHDVIATPDCSSSRSSRSRPPTGRAPRAPT